MGIERFEVLVVGGLKVSKGMFGQVIPELLRIRRILLPVWRNSVSKTAPNNSDFQEQEQGEHTGDGADLGNSVGVTENDTNLRGGRALLGELADLLNDLLGGGLQPRRRVARVGDGGGRNALSVAVKTTHFDEMCW